MLRVAAVALALAAACTPVDRAPRPMTARDWYDAGKRQYKDGAYGQALEAFENAYVLVPDPALLFDMAQANRRLGRFDEAIENYRSFMKVDPGRRAAVEELIAETRREQRRARR